MLIVSRHEGEVLQIGDNIKIKVVEVRGNRVRFGIEAPPEVVIERGEQRGEKRGFSFKSRKIQWPGEGPRR